MAQNEITVDIKLNTASLLAESKAIETAFGAVKTAARGVGTAVAEAFKIRGYTGYVEAVEKFGKKLANELLCLQLNFGRFKAAVVDAVTPLASVFVPLLNDALLAAARFVKGVGAVLRALFGGSQANDAFSESSEKAENAQISLKKAVSATGKAVQKSIAGFDELERLAEPRGGTQWETIVPGGEDDNLSRRLQAIVDKTNKILAPLRAIDFSNLEAALGRLKTALKPFTQELFAGLAWAYENVLVPLAKWTIESFLPAFLDTLSAGAGVLREVLIALKPLANWLWESFLQPIAQWTGGVIVQVLQHLAEKLTGIGDWMARHRSLTEAIAVAIASVAGATLLVNGAMGTCKSLLQFAGNAAQLFGGVMRTILNPINTVAVAIGALIAGLVLLIQHWDEVKNAAGNVWAYIQGIWDKANDWLQQVLPTSLTNGFRNMVNGVIGFLNGMIRGIVSAINTVVNAVNGIQFTVPSWIPGVGGKSVGFHLQTLRTPEIPYLARGAVLPPNKPFLAMVGDQRHGTNVEAPLSTIQEAVATVMQDYASANLAGHEATVAVLREILEAVLGIEIGDKVIADAVRRYNTKMAVVRGG